MEGFWEEKKRWHEAGDMARPDCPVVRIKGNHYVISPDLAPGKSSWLAGHGGARFVIRFISGPHIGRVVETRNLWNQGPIPPEVGLPDNAEFVAKG